MTLLLLLRSAPMLPALVTDYTFQIETSTRTYLQTLTEQSGAIYSEGSTRFRRVEYKTGG